MADPFDPLQQQPKDLAIFLGGSSKKHNYLRKYFEKVKLISIQPIPSLYFLPLTEFKMMKYIQYNKDWQNLQCQSIRTAHCHKHGAEAYTNHYMNKNIRIIAICPLYVMLFAMHIQPNHAQNMHT